MSSIGPSLTNVTVLSSLVEETEHYVRKSKHFAKEVHKLKTAPDEELRSYNVSSVQVDKALVVIKVNLVNDVTLKNRTLLSPEEITKLLELYLKCTYFFLQNQYTSKFMVQPWDLSCRRLSVTYYGGF